MRVIFNEELKAVADDLDHMVKGVRRAINGAGDALLNPVSYTHLTLPTIA